MSARGCIYSRPSFETIDSGERVEEYPAALRRAPRPSASYAQGRSDQRTFYGSPACGASARTVGAQMRSKVPDWVLRKHVAISRAVALPMTLYSCQCGKGT